MQLSCGILPKISISDIARIGLQEFRDSVLKIARWKCVDTTKGLISNNHFHRMLSIPPKYAVSDVVGTIKERVAIRLFKHVPEIRKKY